MKYLVFMLFLASICYAQQDTVVSERSEMHSPFYIIVEEIAFADESPRVHKGALLYIDSHFVLLGKKESDSTSTSPRIIPVSKIKTLIFNGRDSFWTGFTTGAYVGGGFALASFTIFGPILGSDRDVAESTYASLGFGIIVTLLVGIPAGIITALGSDIEHQDIDGDPTELGSIALDLNEHQFFNHGLPPEMYNKLYEK